MIYLIKVRYEDVTLLKVGYAESIKKRLEQYTTENPLFELLDYREGDRKLEEFLHSMFKEYRFEKGREWFYYNDYIVNNFHSDFEESILIEKVKKNIDKAKLFSSKLRLYCKFKEKYPEIKFKISRFQIYLDVLGLDKCKELGYKESLLYKELSNLGYFDNIRLDDEYEAILSDFLDNNFYATDVFNERLKLYCEFRDKYQDNPIIIEGLLRRVDNSKIHQFYNYFGTSGCKAKRYVEGELDEIWRDATKFDHLSMEIYSEFKEGDRFLLSTLKEKIGEIYKRLSISRSPKAIDIKEFFEVSKTNITTSEGVKKGFKLKKRLRWL